MLKLMIIVGSVRPGRVGLPIAKWVADHAEKRRGIDIDFVDLRELALPWMDEPNHPSQRMYQEQHTIDWSQRVEQADAFILVTPEYNSSYSPTMKNALDYLFHEWDLKPAGFVCYGGASSGTRAVASLLPVTSALGLYRVSPTVEIRSPRRKVVDENFNHEEHEVAILEHQLDELVLLAEGLRELRLARRANDLVSR
ncbi:TPA: NAD(P)H-dependent oxidoreductase [Legionella pneumophila]|nr:NAD(P)H-dependent oxidoreductase [Legionella pneumophila]